ncbi:MAG: hypothetical protein AAF687_02115 [Pseudomonadota bacterium]
MTWVAIALIVFVTLYVRERVLTRRLQKQNRELYTQVTQLEGAQSSGRGGDDQDAVDANELDELRERVQVLERIATDDNSSEARKAQKIAREIQSLRGDIARRSSTEPSSTSKEELSE